MLAWIRLVELEAADPWMAIDAQRPLALEKTRRWRPKLSGVAAIKSSSPEAASRISASKGRSKKGPVSFGLVDTARREGDLECFGGRMDQPRAAANSGPLTWIF